MIETAGLSLAQPAGRRTSVPGQKSVGRVGAWRSGSEILVDIETPDGYSAALLVEYAAGHFVAGIVEGSEFTVRLRPAPSRSAGLKVRLLV